MRLIAILCGLLLIAAAPLPGNYKLDVKRVVDGDTINGTVAIWPNLKVKISVRVLGVDTPEMRGKCKAEKRLAREAKAFVVAFLAGKQPFLTNIQLGSFAGRVVGTVTVDGVDIADALVGAGLGRPYFGGHREGWCADG